MNEPKRFCLTILKIGLALICIYCACKKVCSPVSHGAIVWLDDEGLVPSSPLQISHVVAQCIVLPRQDPCTGNIAILFRMQLLHPTYIICVTQTMSTSCSNA